MRNATLASVVLVLLSIPAPAAAQTVGSGPPPAGGITQGGSTVIMPLPGPALPIVFGSGAITGVVIDGTTRAPLADANVYLANANRALVGHQSRQVTDAKGRFAFVNLPESTNYTMSASRPGYLDGGSVRENAAGATLGTLALRAGEWASDVRIAIYRPGAISGTVLDERGDPVVGVFVRALVRLRIQGRDEMAAGPLTTTDDRGVYRLPGLVPGRYVVQVPSVQMAVPPGTTIFPSRGSTPEAIDLDETSRLVITRYPAPPPPVDGRPLAYPITFHPGAHTLEAATVIALAHGEERSGVDIKLEPVRASRVSGVVSGPPEALTSLTLRLLATGLDGLGLGAESATALVDATGRFTFVNVPAGTYTIEAPRSLSELTTSADASFGMLGTSVPTLPNFPGRDGSSRSSRGIDGAPPGTSLLLSSHRGAPDNVWGRTAITVGGQDIADVNVPLRRLATMTGRLVVERDPNKQEAFPSTPQVMFEPADGNPRMGMPRPERDESGSGEFFAQGLLPGDYVVRVNTYNGYIVKSVTWKGRDYSDVSFDAALNEDFSDVVVTTTNLTPTLTGFVGDRSRASAEEGVTVIAFPTDQALWKNYGFSPRRLQSGLVDNTGAYRFTTLPAGDYFVIAISGTAIDRWQDVDFLKKASASASAARVTLAWGVQTNRDLTIATAGPPDNLVPVEKRPGLFSTAVVPVEKRPGLFSTGLFSVAGRR